MQSRERRDQVGETLTLHDDVLAQALRRQIGKVSSEVIYNAFDLLWLNGEDLRRLQVASNFASFFTFTAVVNAASTSGIASPGASGSGGSTLWEDLSGYQEMQSAVAHTNPGTARPDSDKLFLGAARR